MQISTQEFLHLCSILLFLPSGQAPIGMIERPIARYIMFKEDEARRPSGSVGGLVAEVDSYVVEVKASVLSSVASLYPLSNIWFTKGYDNRYDDIDCNIRTCPEDQGSKECYCKAASGTTYTIVLNTTAKLKDRGAEINLEWTSTHSKDGWRSLDCPVEPLPEICEQAVATFTTEGQTEKLPMENTSYKRIKTTANTSLTFEVKNLMGNYIIKIQKDGIDVASTTGPVDTSVTTTAMNSDIDSTFTMSFDEPENRKISCGRSRTYYLIYDLPPTTSTTTTTTTTTTASTTATTTTTTPKPTTGTATTTTPNPTTSTAAFTEKPTSVPGQPDILTVILGLMLALVSLLLLILVAFALMSRQTCLSSLAQTQLISGPTSTPRLDTKA